MASDGEPFLPFKDETNSPPDPSSQSRIKGARWLPKPALFIHLLLISFYTTLTLTVLHTYSRRPLYPSRGPLEDLIVKYKPQLFFNLTGNVYSGPPRAELEAAWEQILEGMYMRVTGEELQRSQQESVALPDGGGYLAWLGTFHALHCLKVLRQWNYRDHYYANLTAAEFTHWSLHADHCIEMLRQDTLCYGDTSLRTFVWDKAKSRPAFDIRETVHTCVDWEALVASAAYRVVGTREVMELVNPLRD